MNVEGEEGSKMERLEHMQMQVGRGVWRGRERDEGVLGLEERPLERDGAGRTRLECEGWGAN